MKCYDLKDIIKELEKELSKNESYLKAWQHVTFKSKKDGKPFSNMSKNIDGARYKHDEYSLQPGENKLVIYINDPSLGYISDHLDCYELVKYLKDPVKISKKENYLEKQALLEQVYCYDLEDIKTAVKERIEHLEDRIGSIKKQIAISEIAYNNFKLNYESALQQLKDDCIKAGDIGFSENRNDLYYLVKDTIIK